MRYFKFHAFTVIKDANVCNENNFPIINESNYDKSTLLYTYNYSPLNATVLIPEIYLLDLIYFFYVDTSEFMNFAVD